MDTRHATIRLSQAMSTPYRITCAPTQKLYRIGLLFTKGSLISARFWQRSDAISNAVLMLKNLRKRTNRISFPCARLIWVRPGKCNPYSPNSDCRTMEGKFPYEPRGISEVMLRPETQFRRTRYTEGCECHYRSKNRLLSLSIILQMEGVWER